MQIAAPGTTRIGWIGTGVMGGMITATVLAVFFVPVFFVVVRRIFKGNERQRTDGDDRRRLADGAPLRKFAIAAAILSPDGGGVGAVSWAGLVSTATKARMNFCSLSRNIPSMPPYQFLASVTSGSMRKSRIGSNCPPFLYW